MLREMQMLSVGSARLYLMPANLIYWLLGYIIAAIIYSWHVERSLSKVSLRTLLLDLSMIKCIFFSLQSDADI